MPHLPCCPFPWGAFWAVGAIGAIDPSSLQSALGPVPPAPASTFISEPHSAFPLLSSENASSHLFSSLTS
ncbi:hypothetical protein LZ554_001069 [Drepanopeziza brunnea f. sp. 'monogermtubi']|nr:hypothetical protein LZ554_001069 [Drepanopeziza brunnea f. sp. 'monogermtubi']